MESHRRRSARIIRSGIDSEAAAHREANAAVGLPEDPDAVSQELIQQLQAEMVAAADALEFERAAAIRDRLTSLQADQQRESAPRPKPISVRDRAAFRRSPSITGTHSPPQETIMASQTSLCRRIRTSSGCCRPIQSGDAGDRIDRRWRSPRLSKWIRNRPCGNDRAIGQNGEFFEVQGNISPVGVLSKVGEVSHVG